MLAHADDYLPEALDAARAEFARRNLSPDSVAQIEADLRTKATAEARVAGEPLRGSMRLLILLGLCPGLWVALYYHANGHKAKARESWKWLLYSYLFWFGLIALGVLLRKIGW